jgi:putative hydrolase of the HAD superfamily
MPPRALLIDGLGTLVSLAPPAPALRGELSTRFGIEVSEPAAARALAAEIAFYRAHMGLGRDSESLAGLRRRCAEVLRGALPPSERLAAVGIEALTDALLSALHFDPYPDARPALLRARAAGVGGVRIIVVSNWDVSLADVLERIGLAPLVDGVVTSAAVGAAKPAPAIFAHALSLAGVSAEQALHVGDSLEEDVAGAQACGIPAVLLRRDGDTPPTPASPTPSPMAAGDGMSIIASLAELDWP